MSKPSESQRVAIIPDVATMDWHHAREDFLNKNLKLGLNLETRGVIVESKGTPIAWCIWTHTFSDQLDEQGVPKGTLIALRFYVDETKSEAADAAYLMFKAIQIEAGTSHMAEANVWNPSKLILEAGIRAERDQVGNVDLSEVLIEREKDSIPSLLWYGDNKKEFDPQLQHGLDWLYNEKYCWC
jgi:hypothetical protein